MAQGPILAFVYAVKELLGEGRPGAAGPGGSLPCNVAFVVEGEEENGSAGFREVGATLTCTAVLLGPWPYGSAFLSGHVLGPSNIVGPAPPF